MSKGSTALTFIVAMTIAVGAFIVLPIYLTGFIPGADSSTIWFNLAEGLMRLGFFFIYLLLISRMKDIHRVFQYHGAEHKVVYAYEADEELTVENAQKHTTLHPRCGTAFIMTVFVIAILIFSLAGNPPFWLRILSRLLLLPVVAGVSYEVLRYSGRNYNRRWVRFLAQPGLWLQKLTTAEPDDDMIEVAIASMKKVLMDPATAVEEDSIGSPDTDTA